MLYLTFYLFKTYLTFKGFKIDVLIFLWRRLIFCKKLFTIFQELTFLITFSSYLTTLYSNCSKIYFFYWNYFPKNEILAYSVYEKRECIINGFAMCALRQLIDSDAPNQSYSIHVLL